MAKVQARGLPEFEVPDDWDKAAVDREIAKRRGDAAPEGPQVPGSGYEPPVSGETAPGYIPAGSDPSQSDSPLTWAGKQLGSAVRGTGKGFARFGDMILNAGDVLVNDVKSLTHPANAPVTFRDTADAPLTTSYEANVPAQPEGSSYENTGDVAEIFGPGAVEALATGGLSLPQTVAQVGGRTALKQLPGTVARTAVRTAKDTALGMYGGEAAGAAAAKVGGEKYRGLGNLAGLFAPSLASGVLDKSLATGLLTPQSGKKLSIIDKYNEGLPKEHQIQSTIGLIGSKAGALAEDLTGKTITSQKPTQVRRELFEKMETGAQEQAARSRGEAASTAQTGPQDRPSRDITPATIGLEAQAAIKTADANALRDLQKTQNDLESVVGRESPTALTNLNDQLNAIINNPKGHSDTLIAQATELRNKLNRNLQRPNNKRRRMTYGTAGYGAIKEARNDLGELLNQQGKPYTKGLRKQAYGGLTRDMEEAAAMQGVTPEEFGAAQKKSSELLTDQAKLKKLGKGESEATTYRKTVGNESTKPLDPLLKHAPDEAIKLVADDLELRLRKGQAGREISAEDFDPAVLARWKTLDPARKDILSRKNPQVREKMDSLAEIASMETSRSGQRTRPNKSGSSLGASIGMGMVPAGGLGGLAYMVGGSPVKIAAATLAGAAAPWVIGRKFTDPAFGRRLAAAREKGLGRTLADALKRPSLAAGAGSANWNSTYDEAQREEYNRKMQEWMGSQ